jgi:Tfp pilus assembly protein FimV
MVVALVLVMAQAGAALGGSPPASPERRPAAAHTSARSTVVRSGDSLWSVASRLVPGSDPRPLVDALAAARHGTVLVPGETIEWDG